MGYSKRADELMDKYRKAKREQEMEVAPVDITSDDEDDSGDTEKVREELLEDPLG